MNPKNNKAEMLNDYYNFVLEMVEVLTFSLTANNTKLTPKEKDFLENLKITKYMTNDLLKSLHEFNNLNLEEERLLKSLWKTQNKPEKN